MAVGVWDVVLYAVAIAAAVWVLVPPIMVLLRLAWVRSDVVAGLGAEPKGDDPDCQRRFRQFEELGFQPAGATREVCWFGNGFVWRTRFPEARWMAMPDGRAVASLNRIVAIEPVRFGLATIFEGGGVVRTTCPGVGAGRDTDTHLCVEYQNLEPAELLGKHREHVEAFARRQGRAVMPATFAETAAAEAVQERGQLTAMGLRGAHFAVLILLLPALLAFHFMESPASIGHRAAIAVLIGAGWVAGFRFFVMPRALAQNALKTHAPAAPKSPPPAGAGSPS